MRLILPVLAALSFAPLLLTPAKADPYRWCAEYAGGARGGNTSCYFVTYEQCRASVSGVGGFCRVNGFYDGLPVRTPEDGSVLRRKYRG